MRDIILLITSNDFYDRNFPKYFTFILTALKRTYHVDLRAYLRFVANQEGTNRGFF